MNSLEQTRLAKAAADCGFDLTPEFSVEGLAFRSTQFPESVKVAALGENKFQLTASSPGLFRQVRSVEGVIAIVDGYEDLYSALQEISTTGGNMPNRVAEKFRRFSAGMPSTTEAERMVVQRVGQNLFRDSLFDYWHGRCCVTGLAIPDLLRASHIKPWALCDSDEERLDVFNGLLLAPNLDALFDGGWVTIEANGSVRKSAHLASEALHALGIHAEMAIVGLAPSHELYLVYHRNMIFRR